MIVNSGGSTVFWYNFEVGSVCSFHAISRLILYFLLHYIFQTASDTGYLLIKMFTHQTNEGFIKYDELF